MHTSLEDVQNNGGNHADGGSGNGNGGDGNSDPSLYDELEDLTGARQTLIQVFVCGRRRRLIIFAVVKHSPSSLHTRGVSLGKIAVQLELYVLHSRTSW